MGLSEKYAYEILKSMFSNYDFDFTIIIPDDNIILFNIKNNKLDLKNNQITLHLSEIARRN